jgi:hypothetical protein
MQVPRWIEIRVRTCVYQRVAVPARQSAHSVWVQKWEQHVVISAGLGTRVAVPLLLRVSQWRVARQMGHKPRTLPCDSTLHVCNTTGGITWLRSRCCTPRAGAGSDHTISMSLVSLHCRCLPPRVLALWEEAEGWSVCGAQSRVFIPAYTWYGWT